jgi:transposase
MGRIKAPNRVRRYTVEFKLQAVKLSDLEGVQVQDVAEALDIHPFMLSRWRKEARDGKLRAKAAVKPDARRQHEVRQLAELKRKYALLKQEYELLKKTVQLGAARKVEPLPTSKRRRGKSTHGRS